MSLISSITMKLTEDQLKELQAILITAIITILIFLTLNGCSFSTLLEDSRQYCASVTTTAEEYQECMKRETRLLDILNKG